MFVMQYARYGRPRYCSARVRTTVARDVRDAVSEMFVTRQRETVCATVAQTSLRLCPHSAARTCPKGSPCGQSKAKAAQQANTQNSVTCPIHKLKLADFNFMCNPIRWWSGSLADY